VRQIRDVLRLHHELHLSARGIGRSLGVHPKTIKRLLDRAERASLGWPLPPDLSEAALEELLYPVPPTANTPRPEPDVRNIHLELRQRGVTLELLWVEYRQAHPDGLGYTAFCSRYKAFTKSLGLTMRKVHPAGLAVEIDYSGMKVPYKDRVTGEVQEAEVFVGCLPASGYIFAEPSRSQDEQDFLASQARMFAAFGGVTRTVILDNLKSGVIKPDRYEPTFPRIYREFADHYGVALLPGRVKHPQDKAATERGVEHVERWVLAPLRKCVFFSIEDIHAAMVPLVEELNSGPLQGLSMSRRDLYERLDRPALRPLPKEPFVFATWFPEQGVGRDYHVRVEGRYYSVPSFLYGEKVEACATEHTVEVFHRGTRIASHVRLRADDTQRTSTEIAHMPPHHRAQAELNQWDQDRFMRWAEKLGPNTAALIQGVFDRRTMPEQAYGTCQGILHAASRGVTVQMAEQAARLCVETGAFTARAFRSLLKEQAAAPAPDAHHEEPAPVEHDNVRGPSYYGGSEQHRATQPDLGASSPAGS
jgi:transposase